MKIALLAITAGGKALAAKLTAKLADATFVEGPEKFSPTLAAAWPHYDAFICIMASGIVVRALAPLLHDKKTDPCVVVLDEQGRYVISLLSGHLGGGNDLARHVATLCGGQAVITTASDVLGHIALDIWARDHALQVADKARFTLAMTQLVNSGSLKVYSDIELPEWPADFLMVDKADQAELIISFRQKVSGHKPHLHPCNLVAGVGCNRGTPVAAFAEAFNELCTNHNLALASLRNLASIDLKNDEKGLLEFARQNRYPLAFYSKDELNNVPGLTPSAAVLKATGAQGVAEPAAILSSNGQLIIGKQKWQDVTIAVAQAPWPWSAPDQAA
ncbi:MAG: cobalt-precorrin 5A hydrolase [Proteobacteria bacterium]|nr:cobalt-precorrin 5A hydrolase [Pseudomonadota bacterium]